MTKLTIAAALGFALQCPPCLAQMNTGMGDITVLSTDIGHFEHGDKIIHIFENSRNVTQNADNLHRWQFMIEPLLATVLDEAKAEESRKRVAAGGAALSDGEMILFYSSEMEPIYKNIKGKTVRFERHRVLVPIRMMTRGTRLKALEVIASVFRNVNCDLTDQNVDVLPVTKVQISMPDIEASWGTLKDTVFLRSSEQYFIASPSTFFIKFDVAETSREATNARVRQLINMLPYMQIDATLSFPVKSTAANIVSVDWSRLKDTDLFVQLEGKSKAGMDGNAYVSRSDLRKLTYSAATQLSALAIVEDRQSFDATLLSALINEAAVVSKSEDWFTGESSKQTYNSDDLKPSIIKTWINKVFTKDQGKDEWKFDGSYGGGGSLLDIIKADVKGSMSTSSLHEFLKEHSIDTEISGDQIIPKSVDLLQINVSKFAAKAKSFVEYRNLEKGGQKPDLKTTIYGKPIQDPTPSSAFVKSCPALMAAQ